MRTIARRPSYPIWEPAPGPQAAGLLAWCPLFTWSSAIDVMGMNSLAFVGSSKYVQSSFFAQALDCNANGRGARMVSPSLLNGLLPVTLAAWVFQVATPAGHGTYFGCTYTSTDSNPWSQYMLKIDTGTSDLSAEWNTAGTWAQLVGTGNRPAVGTFTHIAFTLSNGSQKLYVNGVSVASSSAAVSTPQFTGSPQFVIGVDTSDNDAGRTCGAQLFDCRLYNRFLADAEVLALWAPSTRWDLYRQPAPLLAPKKSGAAAGTTGDVKFDPVGRGIGIGIARGMRAA